MSKQPKKQPKKSVKKTTALAAQEKNREISLMWGGVFPTKDVSEAEQNEMSKSVAMISEAYGVPSIGVNFLGGKPYLNKEARLFLLGDLRKGKKRIKAIRKDFIEYAKTPDDIAICKTTLVFYDGHEIEGIGEASKYNLNAKMGQVRTSVNMMAETRALNRTIWQEVAHNAYERVGEYITRKRGITPEQKAVIYDAGRVSYEEMQQPRASKAKPAASTPEELFAVIKQAVESSKTVDVIIDLDEKSQTSDKLTAPMKKGIHTLALNKVELVESGGKNID